MASDHKKEVSAGLKARDACFFIERNLEGTCKEQQEGAVCDTCKMHSPHCIDGGCILAAWESSRGHGCFYQLLALTFSCSSWQVAYVVLNIFSATAIVFANKAVFKDFGFQFVTTLTLVHTVFTWVGMNALAAGGFFQAKQLSWQSVAPLALGYVGYIVLNNLSLNLNTVRSFFLFSCVGPS